MRFILSLFLLTLLPLTATHANEALKIGDAIPAESLNLIDQNGKTQSFESLTGEKGLVLLFMRSAEWCPHCKIQIIKLNKGKIDPFIEAGYNIATISYDSVEKLNKFGTKHKLEFSLLSDPDSETIRAFGIFNQDKKSGQFGYGIPNPHVYIIGKDQKILSILAEKDNKNQPGINDIIDTINNFK